MRYTFRRSVGNTRLYRVFARLRGKKGKRGGLYCCGFTNVVHCVWRRHGSHQCFQFGIFIIYKLVYELNASEKPVTISATSV